MAAITGERGLEARGQGKSRPAPVGWRVGTVAPVAACRLAHGPVPCRAARRARRRCGRRAPPRHGERAAVGAVEPFRGGGHRRRFARVDRVGLRALGPMADPIAATADAGALRLDHVQRQHGGDGGVGGAASGAQYLDPGGGGTRVGGADHALCRGFDGGYGLARLDRCSKRQRQRRHGQEPVLHRGDPSGRQWPPPTP